MLRAIVRRGADLFEELKGPWRELARTAPGATPFQTFEWQDLWWRTYGSLREPFVVTVYEGDDLVGLMPLMRTRAPWRTIRPMGLGPSDYLHPLSRAGYEEAVARLVVEQIADAKDIDLIDLHQVRDIRSLAGIVDGVRIEQATCLLLDLPNSFETYLGTIGKSLRYDVRKLDKSLFKTGRAKIEKVDAAGIDDGMSILFEQHKLRWRRRGLPGAFLGKSIRFHKEWARMAIANEWLRLSVLRVDDRPIGAIYAMAMGDTTYYYQAGFDPAQGAVSPGTLLVAHTIREAIESGMKHFDFMRGDEPYKRRWKPQHVHKNLRLIAPSRSLIGHIGSSWNRAGSQVESRLRARLEGRGLV